MVINPFRKIYNFILLQNHLEFTYLKNVYYFEIFMPNFCKICPISSDQENFAQLFFKEKVQFRI